MQKEDETAMLDWLAIRTTLFVHPFKNPAATTEPKQEIRITNHWQQQEGQQKRDFEKKEWNNQKEEFENINKEEVRKELKIKQQIKWQKGCCTRI